MDTPVSPNDATVQKHPFRFEGKTGEFFGIWIVNIALTVVTLGIYSAWAKVRTRQYFYGNTFLDGSSFRYTADPKKILIGRLIALALSGAYVGLTKFLPLAAFGFAIALAFVYPWLLVRTYAFNARYSQYRGMAFSFDGSWGGALKVFLAWSLLLIPTFGLFFPALHRRITAFTVGHHRFGEGRFDFKGTDGGAYRVYAPVLIGGFVVFILVLAIVIGAIALAAVFENQIPKELLDLFKDEAKLPIAIMVGLYAVLLPIYALGVFWVKAKYHNFQFNHCSIEGMRFESTQRFRDVLWIGVSNGAVLLLTLGLAWPWARVRAARYRAQHLAVLAPAGALESLEAREQGERSAIAEEVSNVFDFDISL